MWRRSRFEDLSQVVHFGPQSEVPVRQPRGDVRQTAVHPNLEFEEKAPRKANTGGQVEKEPNLETVRSGNQGKLEATEEFQKRASD